MAVVSVEIPDNIAKKFKPFTILKYEILEDTIDQEYENLIDFWENWVEVSRVLSYLKELK